VHVTLDRGEDDCALCASIGAPKMRLQVTDGGLHRFRGLEHEGKLHLPGGKQVPYGLHGVEQDVIEDIKRPVGKHGLIEVHVQPGSVTVDDPGLEPIFHLGRVLPLGRGGSAGVGESFEKLVQRVVTGSARSKIKSSASRRRFSSILNRGGFRRREESRRPTLAPRRGARRRCSAPDGLRA